MTKTEGMQLFGEFSSVFIVIHLKYLVAREFIALKLFIMVFYSAGMLFMYETIVHRLGLILVT